ncbi:hypothetical protein MKZ38_004732 [Zalerion maritima]|uniref:Uncharacterized protein n=1 Tax=Zalerion maritima TaxID=339359 RepID=A0AAD5RX81_9PEZI|nr:hypothetical protein MKZ38_004732 [Zalerion maritima]
MESEIEKSREISKGGLTVEEFRRHYEKSPWLGRWSDKQIPESNDADGLGDGDTNKEKEEKRMKQGDENSGQGEKEQEDSEDKQASGQGDGLWREDVKLVAWYRRIHKLRTFQETEPRFLNFWSSWLTKRPSRPRGESSSQAPHPPQQRKEAESSSEPQSQSQSQSQSSPEDQARVPSEPEPEPELNPFPWRDYCTQKQALHTFLTYVQSEASSCKCVRGPAHVVAKQHLFEFLEWRRRGKRGNPPFGKPKWLNEDEYYREWAKRDALGDREGGKKMQGLVEEGGLGPAGTESMPRHWKLRRVMGKARGDGMGKWKERENEARGTARDGCCEG